MIKITIDLYRYYELEPEAKDEAVFSLRLNDDDWETDKEYLLALNTMVWFTIEGKLFKR